MALSIIVPVFDEVDNLERLHARIQAVQPELPVPYEVIYVDDGSTDGSFACLEALAQAAPTVKVVQLRRNFGQTAAIAAGIDHAWGDVIVLMDADLQNDPTDIPMLVEKIAEGYDVVSGWRIDRKDPWLTRRLPSHVANWLISWATGVKLHDYGCTLKAYRREVLSGFRLYGEMHRFIPAFAGQVGARIAEVPVRHHPRRFGKSKYGIRRTFKVLLDLLTVKFLGSYGTKPIYLFGGAGFLMIVGSLLVLGYIVVRKLLFTEYLIESPLLLMSVMLFILGFQSVLMGLTTELLVRTYHESQDKPTYSVRWVING
jgi:glycosyltransferase involved in cell wall biosynthesis